MNFALNEFFESTNVLDVTPLGSAGGFSGASFWRVATSRGTYCLRRWPREHPSRQHLDFIHRVLQHVKRAGLNAIPVPLQARDGRTWSESGGFLWEATTWMPGSADFWANPSRTRLANAARTLAQFHLAAGEIADLGKLDKPLAISRRIELLRELKQYQALAIGNALNSNQYPAELVPRARRILEHFSILSEAVESALRSVADISVPLQPCIRDIWHDHVLFQQETVSGIVDFGAMQIETIAGDISRMLGSLLRNDNGELRTFALANYEMVHPLSVDEYRILEAFDISTPILSGMNWLRWLYLEQRQFADLDRILARLDEILKALERQLGTDTVLL